MSVCARAHVFVCMSVGVRASGVVVRACVRACVRAYRAYVSPEIQNKIYFALVAEVCVENVKG